MRKIVFLLVFTLVLVSCSQDDEPNFRYTLLPVKGAVVPESFKLHQVNFIQLSYELPSDCFTHPSVYYQYEGDARIVAIRAAELLDVACAQKITALTTTIQVIATQEADYIFKFWKGTDQNGDAIFEEVVVPVN